MDKLLLFCITAFQNSQIIKERNNDKFADLMEAAIVNY